MLNGVLKKLDRFQNSRALLRRVKMAIFEENGTPQQPFRDIAVLEPA